MEFTFASVAEVWRGAEAASRRAQRMSRALCAVEACQKRVAWKRWSQDDEPRVKLIKPTPDDEFQTDIAWTDRRSFPTGRRSCSFPGYSCTGSWIRIFRSFQTVTSIRWCRSMLCKGRPWNRPGPCTCSFPACCCTWHSRRTFLTDRDDCRIRLYLMEKSINCEIQSGNIKVPLFSSAPTLYECITFALSENVPRT